MAPRRADDPELELAPRDLLDDALRVGDRERDVHARVELLELARGATGSTVPPGPVEAPISSAPGQLALGLLAELGEQLLLQREQPLRAPVEAPAGLGRLDAAAGAVEQLVAEPLLERADLQAHGRLRDAELLRRLREASPLDDRAECGKLPRVHKQSLCMRGSGRGLASAL